MVLSLPSNPPIGVIDPNTYSVQEKAFEESVLGQRWGLNESEKKTVMSKLRVISQKPEYAETLNKLMTCALTFVPPPTDPTKWDDNFDAVKIASETHPVLVDNDIVRILNVMDKPRFKGPLHTHKWSSIEIVLQAAAIRYYNEKGEKTVFPASSDEDRVEILNPEGLHTVKTKDTVAYHALRFEIKSKKNLPEKNYESN